MPRSRREWLQAVGDLQQWGGTRLITLQDGAERGVRVVEFRTTTGLEFGVLVDRAMDIAWCRYKGRSVAWHSPTGFVGPWYRETAGLGFLRTFGGGLVVTAGLDHILFGEVDPNDTYNYPGREVSEYGLHGRVSNTAALLRSYGESWVGDRCTLRATGEVKQSGALAENLVLRREVSADLDGRTIQWVDEVENAGTYPTPYMCLYHCNFGAPLLDAACELIAPFEGIRFATPTASGDPAEHLQFHGPRVGFREQAFSHQMRAGADGRVPVALINRSEPSAPWGMVLRYESKNFPYFFQWRYFDAGTYVLGLEPSTNGLTGRKGARESGELTLLDPGEVRRYVTEVEIVDGAADCDRVRAEVATIGRNKH
jgi:hypothetical protein